MAAAPSRPPWFGNVGVQVLAGGAVVYNLYRLVTEALDGRWSEAFLNFAWCVLFGYVLSESLQTRKQQRAAEQREQLGAADDQATEPTD